MRTTNHPSTPRAKKGATLTLERLPADQLRRLVRPHTGYEAFADLFAKLVAEHGDELGTGIDVDSMLEAIRNVKSLQAAHAEAAARLAAAQDQLALVANTELVQDCTAWKEMLLIYGRGKQAGRVNSQIEVALEPFTRFMKRARAKKPVTTPTAG